MKRLAALMAAGALALGLAACGSSSGPAAEAPASPDGTWGTEAEGQPWMNLGSDGKISGSDGCNNLVGQWTQKDGVVDLGAMGSTMMFCEGVDSWLSGAATATISGEKMTFSDAKGDQIGALTRSK
ncbi:META domain-containing protein [Glutamicibacter protophormiae]|uniref:META domain-containing protein n=1 Tax=Glutamicibacter protophormiae TaxID=37930 RepID=UPI002A83180D|nr:META domain-containing protein [Glutamicibacter protophormiae]WPR66025.1 META domain-containing protein [Glutamicibacter protophormiae]WPR69522.1 META domain-containing protein [Glutamicibacter protophormiae]